ncbi:hypothetical protein [Polaribacter irgensii]|jgi:hypothetical protein|uniref:hypothetical protein n=1 Tax=Polaribacter irgensii TaxID=531 RepID=UPI0012DEA504|nr:hypothetical protein [Polaribacter irgensii]
MKLLKRKYNTLSNHQKKIFLSIAIVLTLLLLQEFFNAGKAIGTAYYHLTH